MTTQEKRNYFIMFLAAVLISGIVGGLAGFMAADSLARSKPFLDRLEKVARGQLPVSAQTGTEPIVGVVDTVSPAVVSIIVTKDLPQIDRRRGIPDFLREFLGEEYGSGSVDDTVPSTEKREIGSGSGFIVSKDGLVVTNRHVVSDTKAEYTVVTNKGERHTATILARDPVNDLAILKIEGDNFPMLEFGDSAALKPGQSVIAIGNALGEFSNTVSTGVVSGLARTIDAYGSGSGSERLIGLIQTDASINPGNSGGPLLDDSGAVIGINVAVAQNAQNVGFAIPINQVKDAIESVRQNGRLIRAWLGVRYVVISPELAKARKLPKDYGALVVAGDLPGDMAVLQNSPADKAGLKENDIILEVNGQKIDEENPLSIIISRAKPNDTLEMKIWRDGKEMTVTAKLEELKQ